MILIDPSNEKIKVKYPVWSFVNFNVREPHTWVRSHQKLQESTEGTRRFDLLKMNTIINSLKSCVMDFLIILCLTTRGEYLKD